MREIEQDIYKAAMAQLFIFEYNGVMYPFTNYPYDLTNIDGTTFESVYIQRNSEVVIDLSLEAKVLSLIVEPIEFLKEINTIGGEMIMWHYIAVIPEAVTAYKQFTSTYNPELYKNEDLFRPLLLFKGTFDNLTFNTETGMFLLNFKHLELKRLEEQLLKFSVQRFCNNGLFDENCGLTRASYKTTATVTGVEGSKITSPTFATLPNEYFYLGDFVFEKGGITQQRMITEHTTDYIVIQNPVFDIEIGDTVDVYPGCDKLSETCANKFSNILQFTGFPYLTEEGV